MYGASTNYQPTWTSTLPLNGYGGQGYDMFGTAHVVVIRNMRSDYTYGNEPLDVTLRRDLDRFSRLAETLLERKRRISREQKRLATARLRRFGLPALPEAMFHKPTFVRRACGSRWRVMTP
jgi:hypothetical protein